MQIFGMGTMTFIHQQNDIAVSDFEFSLSSSFKFIDGGGNDGIFFFFQQSNQTFSGFGVSRCKTCSDKVVLKLFYQVYPVADQDKTVVAHFFFCEDPFCEHDHGQRLTAALSMPDIAAVGPFFILPGNAAHNVFHAEELLIACNFFQTVIIKDIIADKFQKPFRRKKRNDCPILIGKRFSFDVLFNFSFLPLAIFFLPLCVEFCRSRTSTVADIVGIHGNNKLGKLERLRNVIRVPVANILLDAFSHIYAGAFAFDDHEWNTIDHDDDIGAGVFAIGAFDGEFFCDLPDVFFGVFPVDKMQVKRLLGSIVKVFFIGATEQKSVIDSFGSGEQTVLQRNINILNRPADGTVGEGSDLVAVSKTLGTQKLSEFISEDDLAQVFPFDFSFRRRNINIPHRAQLIDRPILRLRPLVKYSVVKHRHLPHLSLT